MTLMADDTRAAAGEVSLSLQPTVFGVDVDGSLRQVVIGSVEPATEIENMRIRGACGEWTFDVPAAAIHRGLGQLQIELPEVDRPSELRVEFEVGQRRGEATTTVQPPRRWRIHILHHAHQDPGFVDLPSTMRERFVQQLEDVLTACDNTDPYGDDAKFRWSIEDGFILHDYLRSGPPSRARLMERIRDGSISVGGLYCDAQMDVCGLEELIRLPEFTVSALEEEGLAADNAFLSDVPGMPWSLPQVLRGYGIRSIVWGANSFRSTVYDCGLPRFFRWEGQDGASVLVSHIPYFGVGYAAIYRLCIGFTDLDHHVLEGEMRAFLAPYESDPYDVILLPTAEDFNPPRQWFADFADLWNNTWAYPRLVMSTPKLFFDELEMGHGDALPTVRGSIPDAWVDGHASAAAATAQNRWTHLALPAAQLMASLATTESGTPLVHDESIVEAYRSMIMYDEHTFGWNADMDPYGRGAEHWAQKEAFARDAVGATNELIDRAAESLRATRSGAVAGKQTTMVVANPHSWNSRCVVEAEVDKVDGDLVAVTDGVGEHPAEVLETPDGRARVRALVPSPSCGTQTFGLAFGKARHRSSSESELETSALTLRFDDDGRVRSLTNPASGYELVDQTSPYRLGDYVRAVGVLRSIFHIDERERRIAEPLELVDRRSTPLAEHATFRHSSEAFGTVSTTWSVYHELARVDVTSVIDKPRVYEKEACFVAFPFAVANPEVHAATPGGWIRPGKDQVPGSACDHYAVGEWISINDTSGGDGIVFVSRDAPIVSFGDIHASEWRTTIEDTPVILSMVFNNHWPVNYPICQEGQVVFRYSFYPTTGTFDPVVATRIGREVAQPPFALWAQDGVQPGDARSYLDVDADNVRVETAFVDNHRRMVIRLVEIAGREAHTGVRIGTWHPGSAEVVSLDGRKSSPCSVEDDRVMVKFAPHEIVTLRVAGD